MSRLIFIAVSVVVVLLIGGAALLAYWPTPAPTSKVEKVLPDARFPK